MLGNNMYAYCLNNPVRYEDSRGNLAVENGDSDEDPCDNNFNDYTVSGNTKAKVSATTRAGKGSRTSFRNTLQKLTGQTGSGSDAHHVFPVKYEELFNSIGINIHDPAYGAWWESTTHRQMSYSYNLWWDAFWSIPGVTMRDAFAVAGFLANLFGFEIGF